MIKPAKAGFFVSGVWWWGLHAIPLRRAAPGFMHSGGQPVAIAWSELGRRVRGYGGRRESIPGGSCETSMFRKAPVPPPPPTLDGVLVAMEDQRRCRSFSCVTGRGGVPCRRSGTDATAKFGLRTSRVTGPIRLPAA